jgi:hypothetical protein
MVSVIKLNVVMPSVIMLSVIKLNVVMANVVAPLQHLGNDLRGEDEEKRGKKVSKYFSFLLRHQNSGSRNNLTQTSHLASHFLLHRILRLGVIS